MFIGTSFAQSGAKGDEQSNYADSALYYFNQSRTAQGIDTLNLRRGLDMVWQMTYDPVSFDKLD